MSNSCLTCVSYVDEGQWTEKDKVYGNALPGVASCPRTGRLLQTEDMSDQDAEALAAEVGSKCGQYSAKSRSATEQKKPVFISLSIGIGNSEAEAPESSTTVRPGSCHNCYFSVQSSLVHEETGVPNMFLCSKFGKLVPNHAGAQTAKQCSAGALADITMTMNEQDKHEESLISGVTLAPMLSSRIKPGDLIGRMDKEPAVTAAQPVIQQEVPADPGDWITESPVTDRHKELGIKSWRMLKHPQKAQGVLIPVFDRMYFTPEERALIPKTGSDEHPEKYVDHQELAYRAAVLWREMDETPALHGKAGTGKTEFFRYMAWMMQLPFVRISITRSSEIDELAGKVAFTPERGTFFEYGRIPKAWSKPCVIVLDEPNVGPPDVWQFIRPLTDNSKQLVLEMNNGEIVSRNQNCYMGMAMNPAWDSRNIGAEVISDADGSRLMHIFVDLPSASIERGIISERCKLDNFTLPEEDLDKIMKIGEQLRKLSDDEVIPVTWGIRPQLKVARALKWFTLTEAYRLAATDHLEPEAADIILDVVREAQSSTPNHRRRR